jgi:hypothetical protein
MLADAGSSDNTSRYSGSYALARSIFKTTTTNKT